MISFPVKFSCRKIKHALIEIEQNNLYINPNNKQDSFPTEYMLETTNERHYKCQNNKFRRDFHKSSKKVNWKEEYKSIINVPEQMNEVNNCPNSGSKNDLEKTHLFEGSLERKNSLVDDCPNNFIDKNICNSKNKQSAESIDNVTSVSIFFRMLQKFLEKREKYLSHKKPLKFSEIDIRGKKKINRKLPSKNDKMYCKNQSKSRAIQVKTGSKTKGIGINYKTLMDNYLKTFTDFIITSITDDLFQVLNYQLPDLVSNFNLPTFEQQNDSIKVQGDCYYSNKNTSVEGVHKISKEVSPNHSRYRDEFPNLDTGNLSRGFVSNLLDIETSVLNHRPAFPKEICQTTLNQSIQVETKTSSKTNNEINFSSIQEPEFNTNSNLDRDKRNANVIAIKQPVSVVNTCPLNNGSLQKYAESPNISETSCDVSILNSNSKLDIQELRNNKYRSKCTTTQGYEIKLISLKEFKPIVHNDICSEINYANDTLKTPWKSDVNVTKSSYQDLDHLYLKKSNSDISVPLAMDLKDEIHCEKFPVHCNQSQNDERSQFIFKSFDSSKNCIQTDNINFNRVENKTIIKAGDKCYYRQCFEIVSGVENKCIGEIMKSISNYNSMDIYQPISNSIEGKEFCNQYNCLFNSEINVESLALYKANLIIHDKDHFENSMKIRPISKNNYQHSSTCMCSNYVIDCLNDFTSIEENFESLLSMFINNF